MVPSTFLNQSFIIYYREIKSILSLEKNWVSTLGSLKNFAKWLSGDGTQKGKDRVTSTITKLKLFNMRLNRQVNKLESTAKINRNKAIRAREAGDLPTSKMMIKASLQAKKQSQITDGFRIKIEGIQYRLEQAKAMGDFSSIAKDIATTLGGLQQAGDNAPDQ